jgi:hypothetical protein
MGVPGSPRIASRSGSHPLPHDLCRSIQPIHFTSVQYMPREATGETQTLFALRPADLALRLRTP